MSTKEEFNGPVSGEWTERGVYLSKAADLFGNSSLIAMRTEAAEKFLREKGQAPEIFSYSSSLSGAARNRELCDRLTGEERQAWIRWCNARTALSLDLRTSLMFGTLRAFGDPGHAGAVPQWIPLRSWQFLHIDPDDNNTASGGGITYWFVRVVDPSTTSSLKPSKRRGGKDYAAQDQPLIKEMHRLLTITPPAVGGVWEATDSVADQAAGGGQRDSKRKRLMERYSEVFRTEHYGKD